jgi:glycolate oxidase
MSASPRLLADLRAALGTAAVVADPERTPAYGGDESGLPPATPDVVVKPANAGEVAAVVRIARATRTPVVGRGAGTGKSGAGIPHRGGIVVSFERMARILEVDRGDMVAVVEPGVVTGDLQRVVEEQGLFYAPDPNSLEWCTIGGNIAHNAGGPRCVKYGVTRDYVLGLTAVLGTGEIVRTGRRAIKGVAGYDLTALLVGSEGTLGLVVQATLQLIPRPAAVRTALALFPSEETALAAVGEIFASGLLPRCCEFIDGETARAVGPRSPFRFPDGVGGALLVEVDGSEAAVEADLPRAAEACEAAGASEVLVAQSEAQRRDIWETRRHVAVALKGLYPMKISEDVAVPRGRLPLLLVRLREIGARNGVTVTSYGHAGDGNLHVNLLFSKSEDQPRAEAAAGDLLRAAIELGGTITGEHGVGLAKRGFLGLEVQPETLAAMRRVKALFDPDGVLNPGKLFPG